MSRNILKCPVAKNRVLTLGRKTLIASVVGLILAPSVSFAAGYQLDESSPYWLGMANAGEVAATNEVSSIFTNPANLSSLKGTQFYAGGVLIAPKLGYSNASSTATISMAGSAPFTGAALGGVTSENSVSKAQVVPNMSYGMQLTPTISAGLSVTAPWGTYLKYAPNSVLSNSNLETSLQTVAVSPAISWKVNDQLALGLAINILNTQAKYSNTIAAISVSQNGTLVPFPFQNTAKINMAGLDAGWTLGATFKPTTSTTIGASYRSYVNQTLTGNVVVSYNDPRAAATVPSGRDFAMASFPLPDVYNLGVSQQVTDKLQLNASLRYTMWSRLQTLGVTTGPSVGLNFSASPKWKNAAMFSLGGQYAYNNRLTLRAGVAYDQTPTYYATRDARSPDGDRTWGTFGASYQVNKHLSMDMAFAHIWMKSVSISTNENGSMSWITPPDPTLQTVNSKADFTGSFNELAAAVRYTF